MKSASMTPPWPPGRDRGRTADAGLRCCWPLAGAVAFLWAYPGEHAARAWQAYLVNFVFWTGLSFGALLFSAVLTMTTPAGAGP